MTTSCSQQSRSAAFKVLFLLLLLIPQLRESDLQVQNSFKMNANIPSLEQDDDDSFVPIKLIGKEENSNKVDIEYNIQSLIREFKLRFKTDSDPCFVIKVPGRVNLIGDHVDYCGFPVMPMALDQGINFVIQFVDHDSLPLIDLKNIHHDKYPDFVIDSKVTNLNQLLSDQTQNLQINSLAPKWHDYFLAGIQGVINEERKKRKNKVSNDDVSSSRSSSGLRVLVAGSGLVASSGLSSSSALVCGSVTIASMWISHHLKNLKSSDSDLKRMIKREMASLAASSERLIGTESGGMDQAIAFLGQSGAAKYIEFEPQLRATSIALPATATWFICHSGVTCNKGNSSHYNSRVFDTRVAAALIERNLESSVIKNNHDQQFLDEYKVSISNLWSKKGFISLWDIKHLYATFVNSQKQNHDDEQELFLQLIDLVQNQIMKDKKDNYSLSDILDQLELKSSQNLFRLIAGHNPESWPRFQKLIDEFEHFKLSSRATHVFNESLLVHRFKQTCLKNNQDDGDDKMIDKLGKLMNESQSSMRTLCESSVPEIDSLASTLIECGAAGVRISGAGFGGVVVALVSSHLKESFQEKLKNRFPNDDFTFCSSAADGVTVYSLL